MSLASIGAVADGIMLEVPPGPENATVDPLTLDLEPAAKAVDRTLGLDLG